MTKSIINFLKFYHEEGCIYQGSLIGYFPFVASIPSCQVTCRRILQCAYFLYDFDMKNCLLFRSMDRECTFQVGPAYPTSKECNEEITTPMTTPTYATVLPSMIMHLI